MKGCWILSNAFSACNEMIMSFLSLSLFIFLYIKPSLHSWDGAYLVVLDDCLDVFLDSVCEDFHDYFCINIHQGIGLIFSFFFESLRGLSIKVIVAS